MEPGHEDREYAAGLLHRFEDTGPQWSPVMKTGNTWARWRSGSRTICLNGARS